MLAALYLPAHIWVLLVALPYAIAPAQWLRVLALQAAVHAAYLHWTTRGDPATTGCRCAASHSMHSMHGGSRPSAPLGGLSSAEPRAVPARAEFWGCRCRVTC